MKPDKVKHQMKLKNNIFIGKSGYINEKKAFSPLR